MALTGTEWLILSIAALAGSAIQGSLGFGLNVVLAPIAALVDPDLLPAPLLLLSVVHVIGLVLTEFRNLQIKRSAWVLVGRVPGVVLAVWILASVSRSLIELLFGIMLLSVTLISLTRRGIEPSRRNLLGAGFVSGITGTTVSVGGPPIALVLAKGGNLRADMTAVFALGTIASVTGIVLAGQVQREDVDVALSLMPAVVIGFAVSRLLVHHLDHQRTSVAVHTIAALAASVLLVRALV